MRISKRTLLAALRDRTFFRVMPSPAHGVGLFAIRGIPKGTNLFPELSRVEGYEISREELATLPPGVQRLLEDYWATGDGEVVVPRIAASGYLLPSSFMNHSESPNVVTDDGGTTFHAARAIEAGEEITVDYRTYCEGDLLPGASEGSPDRASER